MQKFGGDHTSAKLDAIENYLNAYTTALSKQPFDLTYVDAFAGSGRFELSGSQVISEVELPMLGGVEDFTKVVEGSALRSLQVDNPFDRYIFSDTKRTNVHKLSTIKDEFPQLKDRIQITHEDANEVVKRFCKGMGKNDRAIIFLDPFGNQVDFGTLEAIAETRKVDLWYLFPSWWG